MRIRHTLNKKFTTEGITMIERSEGVKRIVKALSVLCGSAFFITGVVLIGDHMVSPHGHRQALFVGKCALLASPIAYLIPVMITNLIYWIKEGFAVDKG
jgi:hypothetical protein